MADGYHVGQTIEARYQAQKYGASGTLWFQGQITAVEKKGVKNVYDVLFGDVTHTHA